MEFDNYIFDLYGTLIDVRTDEHSDETWEKWILWLDRHRIRHPELKEFREEFFAADKRYRDEMLARGYCEVPEIDIIDVYRELFEGYGNGVLEDDFLSFLSYNFRVASRDYIRLFPGVPEYLEKIRTSGSHAYILSNAQATYTEPEIMMFGLNKMVDDFIMSSDFKVMKPDVRFFDVLINRHHMDRSRTVMLGDSAASDIAGAKAAGIHSVHLVDDNHPSHYYLDRLKED